MPYIGVDGSQNGLFQELDSLTASATDDYTLKLNGADYFPETVNNLLVSINGVIQGGSTMSLNGAVLTVGATLSSSDTIDFVRVFGNVGTVSTPTDGSVTANKIGTGAITNAKIADNASISGSKLGTGAVLQVKQSQFLGNEAFNNTSYANISDMTVTITPKSTSSKMLIQVMVNGNANADQRFGFKVVKFVGGGSVTNLLLPNFSAGANGGATTSNSGRILAHAIGKGGGSNASTSGQSITLLDAPNTTSEIVYKLQGHAEGSQYLYINSFQTFSDNSNTFAPMSTFTVSEIGG